MARTTSRTKRDKFSIRRVNTKEDRKRPSVFLRLKADEAFKAYALFEPDPEVDDNPGYFEYYDHYDQQANQYVPCAGDKCPFCAANSNPSTRAMTAWYFPDAGDVKDQIKIFTMNFSTTQEASDESEDEDGMLGKQVRIKRLSEKGDYRVKITQAKPLTKAELKKAMAALEEKLGEGGMEGIVVKQLRTQMERLKALEAMEDDDDEDDDEEETPKARRGKAVEDDADDDEDEEDEDDEEEEDEEEDDDEDEEDEEEDDEDEEDEDDEEDDDEEESEDDDEEEEDDDEEAGEISGEYEVLKVQEKDEIFDLQNDDGKIKAWLGDGVDVDYDAVKKGVKVNISAQQDDEGDWVITEISVVKPKTRARRTTTTRASSSRSKSKTTGTTRTRKTGGTSRTRKR